MKKVFRRVLVMVICLAMVMESQAVSVWAEEISIIAEDNTISSEDETLFMDQHEDNSDDDLIDDNLVYEIESDTIKDEDTISSNNSDSSIDFGNDKVEISGTDSFGKMLGSVINEKTEEQDKNNGCNVYSVEMSGKTATVEYESVRDAELVVAIYEEDGIKQLASGKASVTKDNTKISVTIDIDLMPSYFYLRAYLIVPDTLEPLCTAYETPNYTQEMQEFFSKTTDDFDSGRVLNLDGDKTDNYLVFNAEVVRVPEEADTNRVVSADDATQIYIFEKTDDRIKGLKKGDTLSYEYTNGTLLIIEVNSVQISDDESTVTIKGADSSLEDVFEYVRIDTESGMNDVTIDDSELEEGVTHLGSLSDEEFNALNNDSSLQNDTCSDELSADKLEADAELSSTYKLKYKMAEGKSKGENIEGAITITGSIGIKFKGQLKCYISWVHQYIEYRLDSTIKISIAAEGKVEGKIPLGKMIIVPVTGVTITYTNYFVIKTSGKYSGEFTCTETIGKAYDSKKGLIDLTTGPKGTGKVNGEVTIFVGLAFECKLTALSDDLANMSITAELGIEINGELVFIDTSSSPNMHLCEECIDGDIMGKFEVSFGVSVLKNNLCKGGENKITASIKLADWYFSYDHNELGWGECPHLAHKVTLKVVDKDAKGLKDAVISTSEHDFYIIVNNQLVRVSSLVTNGKGKVTYYQTPGLHKISIKTGGFIDVEKTYEVRNGKLSLLYSLEKSNGDSPKEDDDDDDIDDDDIDYSNSIGLDGYTSALLKKDGSLWMWGRNNAGQLGIGYTSREGIVSTPVKVMDDVRYICVGGESNAAIKNDNSLWTWGDNSWGECGTGNTIQQSYPIKVMDNVKTVAMYNYSCAAIKNDGSVWTWGDNAYGQLGDGTCENRFTPAKIMEGAKDIAAGLNNYSVIKKDGSLWSWGWGEFGQLFDGKATCDYYVPYPIKTIDNVKKVSLGDYHSAVIKSDDSLWICGTLYFSNIWNDTERITTPIKIMDDVKDVSINYKNIMVLKKDGSLWTWGDNQWGELGDGSTITKSYPVKIMENVAEISCGGAHNAAIKKDGSLWIWGLNNYGQLGNGTTTNSLVPIKLMDNATTSKNTYLASYSVKSSVTSNALFSDKVDNDEDHKIINSDGVTWSDPININNSSSIYAAYFTGMDPNTTYNFYVMNNRDAENKLDPKNLLYIAQGVANDNGNLTFKYAFDKITDNNDAFAVKLWDSTAGTEESEEGDDEDEEKIITFVTGQKINIKSECFADISETISRYVVSDRKIATVSKDTLTCKKAGLITVTAQKMIAKNKYEDVSECTIKVLNKPKLKFNVPMTYDGQTLNASTFFITDDTKQLGATEWESSKPSVVEFTDSKSGVMKAHAPGSAKITAYFGEKGKQGTLKVSASISVKYPSFQKAEYKVQTGAKLILAMKNVNAALKPDWMSSEPSIAQVSPQLDKKGNKTEKVEVEGLSYGDTTLIGIINGHEYSCTIHVTAPSINKKTMTIGINKSGTLSLKNTKIKKTDVKWESSDTNIATVDANGKVTGVSKGEVMIFTNSGGYRNECTVTVK